jgi:hypothetical protein
MLGQASVRTQNCSGKTAERRHGLLREPGAHKGRFWSQLPAKKTPQPHPHTDRATQRKSTCPAAQMLTTFLVPDITDGPLFYLLFYDGISFFTVINQSSSLLARIIIS